MRSLLARVRCESGQAFVFVAFMLVVLVGMAGLVIDVGSWFQADRQAQTAADAAALAGAQELPRRGDAEAWATEYWSKNADDPTNEDPVSFPDPAEPEYQITVKVTRKAEAIFAKVFGIDSVTVAADAQAQILTPHLKNVAPIAVYKDEACIVSDASCFGETKVLEFDENDPWDPTKSKFGLLDLDRDEPDDDKDKGAGEMKEWIADGYPGYLPVNVDYPDRNGFKNGIKTELNDAVDDRRVLLFPVFDDANSSTGYHVIGWAAFVIEEVVNWGEGGDGHVLKGHFVEFTRADLQYDGGTPGGTDFGVPLVITLTK